jgi:hypothetical protein
MAFLIVWTAFGALVGYLAARKRGWSPAAGMLGGVALGVFSPALFAVSGVTREDRSRICPHCAERIRAAAKVCRYCHGEVEPSDH